MVSTDKFEPNSQEGKAPVKQMETCLILKHTFQRAAPPVHTIHHCNVSLLSPHCSEQLGFPHLLLVFITVLYHRHLVATNRHVEIFLSCGAYGEENDPNCPFRQRNTGFEKNSLAAVFFKNLDI